ncbi:MAG: alpha/beta hydrolase, partial [Cyanobacteria bacterium P01_F01_bin.3]
RWSADPTAFTPAAMSEYLRCFRRPDVIHGTCEDYRAAASIDLAHDQEDLNRKIKCPLLVLWGGKGAMEQNYDVLAVWRDYAETVQGQALDCGHFVPEEADEACARSLLAFFAD